MGRRRNRKRFINRRRNTIIDISPYGVAGDVDRPYQWFFSLGRDQFIVVHTPDAPTHEMHQLISVSVNR